jgi:hypothetical protein
MFRREPVPVWLRILILSCVILVGLEACGTEKDEEEGKEEYTATPGERFVFVSPDESRGQDFGGLQAADSLCQAWASDCGLAGSYKAWLSDSRSSPATRFTKDGMFKRVDGTMLAASWDDLTDGAIQAPINLDCHGTPVPAWTMVFTGTRDDGHRSDWDGQVNRDRCNDWRSPDPDDPLEWLGVIGFTHYADGAWTGATQAVCRWTGRLYCFQQ